MLLSSTLAKQLSKTAEIWQRNRQGQSLEFSFTGILFNILGAVNKDIYIDICKYFNVDSIDWLLIVRLCKFILRYCAPEGDVCRVKSEMT